MVRLGAAWCGGQQENKKRHEKEVFIDPFQDTSFATLFGAER